MIFYHNYFSQKSEISRENFRNIHGGKQVLDKLFGRLRRPIPPANHGTAQEALLLIGEYRRRGTEAVRSDPAFRQKLGNLMTNLALLIELHNYLEFKDDASRLIEDYERRGAQVISKDQTFRQKLEELTDFSCKNRSAKIRNSSLADKIKKISWVLELVSKALQLSEKYLNEGEDAIKEDESSLEEIYNITERAKADGFTYAQFRATEIGMIIEGIQKKLSPVRRAYWLIRVFKLREAGKVSDQGTHSLESIRKEIKDVMNEPVLEGMQVREELERILAQIEQSHASS